MNYDREKLIEQLTRHEGCVLHVYKDSLDIDTIGIGRNIEHRGISKEELEHMNYDTLEHIYVFGITENDAKYLLSNDVDIVERELHDIHPCVDLLTDNRKIVLLNMAFNLGVPRLCKFTNMWAEIHAKDYNMAAYEMINSRWARQVKGRSKELADIMREG